MAGTITSTSGGRFTKVALAAGQVSDPIPVSGELTIVCTPGGGGTMLAEATWSSDADVNAGTARWLAWDAGAASAMTAQLLAHASYVRFTATGAAGVAEVAR